MKIFIILYTFVLILSFFVLSISLVLTKDALILFHQFLHFIIRIQNMFIHDLNKQ
jgi:hypothetical protein